MLYVNIENIDSILIGETNPKSKIFYQVIHKNN